LPRAVSTTPCPTHPRSWPAPARGLNDSTQIRARPLVQLRATSTPRARGRAPRRSHHPGANPPCLSSAAVSSGRTHLGPTNTSSPNTPLKTPAAFPIRARIVRVGADRHRAEQVPARIAATPRFSGRRLISVHGTVLIGAFIAAPNRPHRPPNAPDCTSAQSETRVAPGFFPPRNDAVYCIMTIHPSGPARRVCPLMPLPCNALPLVQKTVYLRPEQGRVRPGQRESAASTDGANRCTSSRSVLWALLVRTDLPVFGRATTGCVSLLRINRTYGVLIWRTWGSFAVQTCVPSLAALAWSLGRMPCTLA